ncbi:MAG: ribbon-helix-helix protein, CopG family [Cyanobacteria bacterium REEB65]|nr:ribbon-helix-helix protein, CopG family [Cyanobacteria bacterium REEB65]
MDSGLTPLERMAEEAKARRASKPARRTANQVVVEDETLRPYSARLTAKEIVRLKAMARAEGMSPSDLLRRVLNEGLNRLEVKRANRVSPEKAASVIDQIVAVLDSSGISLAH